MKMGATLVDGFDVDTIEEHNDMVTVTGTDKTSYTAPSLGRNVLENNFFVNYVIQFYVLDLGHHKFYQKSVSIYH